MTAKKFLQTEPVRYSDWFGDGDSHRDYNAAVVKKNRPPPGRVLMAGNMLCLVWKDRIVVTGYDGNEYLSHI